MKRILVFFMIFVLSACSNNVKTTEDWGSFTAEKTFSYDNEFYALQSVEKKEDTSYIVVDIYSAENNDIVYSFTPARAWDFWGICWENNSYNIWIQSADIGVLCYTYEDNKWELDKDAVRPEHIKSKYDKYIEKTD